MGLNKKDMTSKLNEINSKRDDIYRELNVKLGEMDEHDESSYALEIEAEIAVISQYIDLLKEINLYAENGVDGRKFINSNIEIDILGAIKRGFAALIQLQEKMNSDNEQNMQRYRELRDEIAYEITELKNVDVQVYDKFLARLKEDNTGKLIKYILDEYYLEEKRKALGLPPFEKTTIQRHEDTYAKHIIEEKNIADGNITNPDGLLDPELE